jgi:hypothetical protein
MLQVTDLNCFGTIYNTGKSAETSVQTIEKEFRNLRLLLGYSVTWGFGLRIGRTRFRPRFLSRAIGEHPRTWVPA